MEYNASTFTLENENEKVRKEALAALQALPDPANVSARKRKEALDAASAVASAPPKASAKNFLRNKMLNEEAKKVAALEKNRQQKVAEEAAQKEREEKFHQMHNLAYGYWLLAENIYAEMSSEEREHVMKSFQREININSARGMSSSVIRRILDQKLESLLLDKERISYILSNTKFDYTPGGNNFLDTLAVIQICGELQGEGTKFIPERIPKREYILDHGFGPYDEEAINAFVKKNSANINALQKAQRNAEEEDARLRVSVKPRVVALIKQRVDSVREQISNWTPDYIHQYIAATPAQVSVASRFSETWRWHYPERRTQEQIEQAMWGAHVGLAEKLRTREDIIAKELYDELLKPELEKLNEEIRKKMVTGGQRRRRLSRNKRKSSRRSKTRRA